MTKSELINKIYLNSNLSLEDITVTVNCIIDKMTDTLGGGDRIEIRGLGSFSLHHRERRVGRNPKNGDAVAIPEKYVTHFKPGKALRERANAKFLERSS